MRAPAVLPMRRNRDFMILWSGDAISALGTSMSMLVFPLVGYAITGSAIRAGLATTAVLLGGAVARLPAGALVDRWPRGRVLLIARIFGAICYGSLAVAALSHHLVLSHLVVVGFLSGIADAFVDPATSAAVRTVVPQEQLPNAFSQMQARTHAADLVGPPLGGALFSLARGLPFLVDAVSYAAAAFAITRLHTSLPAPDRSGAPTTVLADMAEGMRFLWRQAVLRSVVIWGAAINFSVTLVLVTITLRLIRAGVHPAAIGLIDTIAAAAGLVGALVAPLIIARMRTGMTTFATGIVLAAIVVPMAWTTDVAVIGALLGIGFFLIPANNSGIGAYLVAVTPNRLQGRVNAAGGLISSGILPLAPAAAGLLVGWAGGRAATIVGAACVAASLLPLLASSAIRGLGRPDAWHAEEITG